METAKTEDVAKVMRPRLARRHKMALCVRAVAKKEKVCPPRTPGAGKVMQSPLRQMSSMSHPCIQGGTRMVCTP